MIIKITEIGFKNNFLKTCFFFFFFRILTEFQSRKAHRVLVRDKDLLKYQAGIILIVIGYMAAWTAINMDHIREGNVIIATGKTANTGLKYIVCRSLWWEYVTETGQNSIPRSMTHNIQSESVSVCNYVEELSGMTVLCANSCVFTLLSK